MRKGVGEHTDAGDGKWDMRGTFSEKGGDTITVTEVPIGKSFLSMSAFYSSEKSPVRLIEVSRCFACEWQYATGWLKTLSTATGPEYRDRALLQATIQVARAQAGSGEEGRGSGAGSDGLHLH